VLKSAVFTQLIVKYVFMAITGFELYTGSWSRG